MRRNTAQKAAFAAGLSLSFALAGSSSGSTTAHAAPDAQGPAAGAVIGLAGTSHLFVADAQGALHWAGDTRSLAGQDVRWSDRREVTLDQLRGMQRGAPLLSAGLLKSGDPIYLVKWESGAAAPQLLRIQDVADVELFGITGANYGQLVMDEATWREKFGFDPSTLAKGMLPSAAGTMPMPGAMPSTTPLAARQVRQYKEGTEAVHEVEITGAVPGARLQVSGTFDRIGESSKDTFGPEDAGSVSAEGTLRFRRTHPVYSGARYTFTDAAGNAVMVTFTGD